MSQSDSQLQELAKTLSDAYYQLLQYKTLTDEQINKSLDQLSKHSNDLPVSWFTHQWIDILLVLKDKPEIALEPIMTLLSSWLRRYPTMSDTKYQNVMETVLQVALTTDQLAVQKSAWIGWVSLIGRTQDPKLLEGMVKIIINTKDTTNADAIHAGVAHALAQTNCLNDFELDSCQALLMAYVEWIRQYNQSPEQIMSAMEHVVDTRSKQKKENQAEAELLIWTELVTKVVDETKGSMASLAIVAGSTRMLQFSNVQSKKVSQLRKEMEQACIEQLNQVMAQDQERHYQDDISLIAAKSLIPMPSELVHRLEHKSLYIQYLASTLLTHQDTFNSGQPIHALIDHPDTTQLEKTINTPWFKEIGRISRTLAKLNSTWIPGQKGVEKDAAELVDRLNGFSYNIFFDWDQALLKHAVLAKQENKAIWTFLKSMLFSTTVILKSVAVDIPNGQGLVSLPHTAQDIISIYANLHFITQYLDDGAGRQAYQDTLTNAVAYLMHPDHHCQLNQLLSLAFKEYATPRFVPEETPFVELISKVKQARLTFFTDLVEQVIKNIEDSVFEQDILPVIYPILKWKEIDNKELYESAHTVAISAFVAEKPVSRELAAVYAKLLIESYPNPMNLDQLRFGFTAMINALCSLDDALAWLTVNQLIQKIDALDENVVLKNEYTTVLIDLLKPLSLGPFFSSALDQVKRLILAQETKELQKSTMKILFDTLSQSGGISDMRKTEAVGWYLELKHTLNL